MEPGDIVEEELERLQERTERGKGLWKHLQKSRWVLVVLAVVTAYMQLRKAPEELSSTMLDAAAILQVPAEAKVVRIVEIDEDFYRNQFKGQSPLRAELLSQLINDIARGRPKVIIVDVDTSHESDSEIQPPPSVPVVWASSDLNHGQAPLVPDHVLGGQPREATLTSQGLVALDLIPQDSHGVVRKYQRRFPVKGGRYLPSLEFAGAQAFRRKAIPQGAISEDDNVRLLDFRYKFFPKTAKELIAIATTRGWPEGEFKDSVVVLGGTYREGRDVHSTPVGEMNGLELVAQGTEAEIEDTGIRPANPWFAGFLQLTAGLVVVLIYWKFNLRPAFFTSLALVPVLSILTSVILFNRAALWAPMLPILISILLAQLYAQATFYLSLFKRSGSKAVD